MPYTTCIDWLSFTAKEGFSDDDLLSIIAPVADRIAIAPQFGYTTAFECTTAVRMYSNHGRPDMGLHFVISGASLRDFAANGRTSRELLRRIVHGGGKVSRLDFAKDAYLEGIDLRRIGSLAVRKYYTGYAQSANVVQGSEGGYTLYVGSRHSERFIRIYDKSAEQHLATDWIRAEIETKGAVAKAIAGHLSNDVVRWDDVFGQLMESMFMVNDPTYKALIRNSATEGVPKVEKTPDTEKWIHDQVLPAVTKYLMQHPDSVAIAELYVCIGKYLNRDVI
jgi:phage replication initiation protein